MRGKAENPVDHYHLHGESIQPRTWRRPGTSLKSLRVYVATAARNRRLRALSRAVRRTLRSAAESQA